MTIDIAQLHQIALHQKQRNVDTVEFMQNNARVRIRFNGQNTHSSTPTPIVPASTASQPHTDNNLQTVKSDKLGILRLSHPASPSQPVQQGDTVVTGQAIVYLQVGVSLVAITSPYNGVLTRLLVSEGQCVDYGLPLFDIAVAQG